MAANVPRAAGCLTVALLFVLTGARADNPKEPAYKGVPLSQWVERLKAPDASVRLRAARLSAFQKAAAEKSTPWVKSTRPYRVGASC